MGCKDEFFGGRRGRRSDGALTRIFSDPKLAAKAHFRCSVDGPTEMDRLFESIMDETFGLHARSEYKRWVSRLYRLGLIPEVPDWGDPQS